MKMNNIIEKLDMYLCEDVFDASAMLILKNGKKKMVTKPMSAKNVKDAEKQFVDFVKGQIKLGHLDDGTLKDIKVKKA